MLHRPLDVVGVIEQLPGLVVGALLAAVQGILGWKIAFLDALGDVRRGGVGTVLVHDVGDVHHDAIESRR